MSHWERLAELPLAIDGYALLALDGPADGPPELNRTLVRLSGGGYHGDGEDISAFGEYREPVLAAGPVLPLAGSWTLGSFVARLAELDQWAGVTPEWEMALRWRNWAYESAALDLALQQAGLSLAEALGLSLRPLTFVNSLGLGDPPSTDTIATRIAQAPSVGFKLDAAPSWTQEILDTLAATGRVRTIDFKGRYGLEVADEDALLVLYDRVLATFGPEVILEDPHDIPAVLAKLPMERVSFDAPIARVSDITTGTINVKPSRIGSLIALLDIYEHCDANGIVMYGGGMGELGIARGQIELLASLFHPDTPNDVAPSAYNLPDPPAGLPGSPLDLGAPPPGFRLTA